MKTQKMIAIVLLVAGTLGLAYGGFSYTRDSHKANIGALHMSIDENRYVSVPIWVGISALVIGGILLVRK